MEINGDELFREDEAPRKKKQKRHYWWVIALAVLILVVWSSLQILQILVPSMKTAIATQGTMDEFILAKGIAAMQSVPVVSENFSGALHYSVKTGKRISQSVPVIEVFKDNSSLQACLGLQAIKDEISQLELAEKIRFEGGDVDVFIKQQQEALHSWFSSVETGNYSQLAAAQNDITLASNKIQIVTEAELGFAERLAYLYEQQALLESAAVPQGYVEAPESGYFVPSSHFDKIIQGRESLQALSAKELLSATEAEEYYPENVVGHIITDYRWYFVTSLSMMEAKKLYKGQSLQLDFSDYDFENVPVTVESITPDADEENVKVEFKCEIISANILKLRSEKARIIFKTEQGIKIDKKALHIVDGQNGVYVRFGSMIYFKKVLILLEDEYQYLVKNYSIANGAWIELYDEVIVDAGGRHLGDKQIV